MSNKKKSPSKKKPVKKLKAKDRKKHKGGAVAKVTGPIIALPTIKSTCAYLCGGGA